mmetsp:Transcript_151743/g.264413  ORF Transcript_151743/g.264413 Transcript_151743/m.264413 type:complete len:415 (+) Transcript_151743:99-1343(+)
MHDLIVNVMSLLQQARPLTAEEQGLASVSSFLVTQSDQFWAGLTSLLLIVIVWFLMSVNLNEKREDLSTYQALPVAVIWSAMGISLILFNKLLFLPMGHGFGFPFAVFLMWWHALVGTISTNVLRFLRPSLIPAVANQTLSCEAYFVNVLPIAAFQAAALALGNTSYLYLSVAYIQMISNTSTAFIYTNSILLSLEKASFSTTFAVLLVVLGLITTTAGEFSFSLIGFVCQMASTLCDSIRLVLTKIILSTERAVRLDPVSALYYGSPTMLVFLTPAMLLHDWPSMTTAKLWQLKYVLLSNALIAFGVNITAMFFIKRCGPTTYSITGVARNVTLVLFSCIAFNYPITSLQFAGFIVSLIGFQLYNKLKEDDAFLQKLFSCISLFGRLPASEGALGKLEEAAPLLGQNPQKNIA